jgi:hypothetical protein
MVLTCSTETGYLNADGNLLVLTRGERCETEMAALGMWKIRHSGLIYSQHYSMYCNSKTQEDGAACFLRQPTGKRLNNKHSKRAPNPSQINMNLYIPKTIN